jgi:hypothetical protein
LSSTPALDKRRRFSKDSIRGTMKPIYFPFTYIPESAVKVLSACFRQTVVYQISGAKIPEVMQELSREGILDIHIPEEVNGKFLDKILKDYRTWVNIHQGTEIAFLAAMANKIPFFDESASSQIRADLKKIRKQIPAKKKSDPLFQAKLFLHMAQEYDRENERLSEDLMNIEAMEEGFMKDLKGENNDDQAGAVAPKKWNKGDPGHYMTTERINAWVSLMLHDPLTYSLLITTSRAVLKHLLDIMPEMEQVVRFDALPIGLEKNETLLNWQDNLMEALEKLATESWPAPMDDMTNPPEIPGGKSAVALTIYIVQNKTPQECFSDCVKIDVLSAESSNTGALFKNTLIGLVEKND